MSSVLISGRRFTPSAELASGLAERLGYPLVDEAIFAAAAERYGAPEEALRKAFGQPPSLFGMSDSKRRRLATAVRAALASRLVEGAIVFHGPFSRQMIRGVADLVMVRVTASVESRAAVAVEAGTTKDRAGRVVAASDQASHEIALAIFGTDDSDDEHDLVVDVSVLGLGAAIERAEKVALADKHRPTSFSRRCLTESASALHIAATLCWELDGEYHVSVFDQVAKVRTQAPPRLAARIQARAQALADGLDGVTRVELQVVEHDLRPSSAGVR